MNDREFLLLMHADATGVADAGDWDDYFRMLRDSGALLGGSSIGDGGSFRKAGPPSPVSRQLVGYIKVAADSIEAAERFLTGNPVYENGGSIEIRELPRD